MNFKFPQPIRRLKRRLLRKYRYIAREHHGPCHQCQHPIEPGDRYEGVVYAVEGHGIQVNKYHEICPDDWFREQQEEVEELIREEDKRRAAIKGAA